MARYASSLSSSSDNGPAEEETLTILGFGSLLSERSSRMTFPDLKNFRLARLPKYRRVFGHPASIFFQRNIANMETLEMSSLSVEYVSEDYAGFLCAAYEVAKHGMMDDGMPSLAYLEREEEFDIQPVMFFDLTTNSTGEGICCLRSTDENYIQRWGKQRFDDHFTRYGVDTIWNWPYNSGLRPCALYLRHCYLAAQNMGTECFESFLDETYLVDRKTTIRDYLIQHPAVLDNKPPPDFVERYSG